jgi:hypothetical protein
MQCSLSRVSAVAGALTLAFLLSAPCAVAGEGPSPFKVSKDTGRSKIGKSGQVYHWKPGC